MLLEEQDGAEICVVVVGCCMLCVNEIGKGRYDASDKTDDCGVEGQE